MKAHELAAALLAGPNIPVVINGWGSDEGFTFEVTEVSPSEKTTFNGAEDTKLTPRDAMGYQHKRECVSLGHCRHAPRSERQIREEAENRCEEEELKRRNPRAHALLYASITPLKPEDIIALAEQEECVGAALAAKLKETRKP